MLVMLFLSVSSIREGSLAQLHLFIYNRFIQNAKVITLFELAKENGLFYIFFNLAAGPVRQS